MNKHIELVEKWLEDNNSVSLEELRANTDAADAAYEAAYAAAYTSAADAAAYATEYVDYAEYYVNRYKELTKGDV